MAKFIRRLLVLLILIGAVVLVFQWKNYQKKVESRDNALLYFKEQDYQKAIRYLEEGLEDASLFSGKIDRDISCYLAESYQQIGQHDKAIQLYNALIEDNSGEKMYYLLKGDACQASGETEQAVKAYDTGWNETKETVFLKKISDVYVEAGDFDTALKYAAIGQSAGGSDQADFLRKAIVIYEKKKDYEKAYELAVDYIQKFPEEERGQREYRFLSTRIAQ